MSSLILPNTQIDNIKMVIFDKDGTLIDVHHYWCSMIEYRAEFFVNSLDIKDKKELYNNLVNNMGIDLKTKKMKAEGPVGIKPRSCIVNVALDTILKYDKNYTKDMVENIFLEVDEYSKNNLTTIVKALPNVNELLEELKQSNIKITIATTDLTKRANLAMESLQLDKYFIDIVGADLVKNAKPNPDLVNYILNKYNLTKDDVVVIGDSMADLGMAKNASCKFLAVKSGLYTNEFIKQSKNIIDDLTQLKVKI
jgi:HAD superfamily hydrolase (TIGR01549 family)